MLGSYLYVGTRNTSTGAEVWRSSDGTTWTQVNTDGFGDSNNGGAYSMAVLGSYLYVGTRNTSTGAEVWRSDGVPTAVTLQDFTARPAGGGNGLAVPLALVALGAVGLLALRRSLSRARSRG